MDGAGCGCWYLGGWKRQRREELRPDGWAPGIKGHGDFPGQRWANPRALMSWPRQADRIVESRSKTEPLGIYCMVSFTTWHFTSVERKWIFPAVVLEQQASYKKWQNIWNWGITLGTSLYTHHFIYFWLHTHQIHSVVIPILQKKEPEQRGCNLTKVIQFISTLSCPWVPKARLLATVIKYGWRTIFY